ncbi:hypothetical protein [Streptomyces hayashii]|uniref:hypothetical protein n=1 Tax=Streptomyces hayashii TaxID=2839966 RepID=UPI00403C981A
MAEELGADLAPAEQQQRGDCIDGGTAVVSGRQGFGDVQSQGQQAAQVHQTGCCRQLLLRNTAQRQQAQTDEEPDHGQVNHGGDQRRDRVGHPETKGQGPDVAEGEDERQQGDDRHDHGHRALCEAILGHQANSPFLMVSCERASGCFGHQGVGVVVHEGGLPVDRARVDVEVRGRVFGQVGGVGVGHVRGAHAGEANGPENLTERHDDYITERMRERFGDSA